MQSTFIFWAVPPYCPSIDKDECNGDIVNSITYGGKTYTITRAFQLEDFEIDFRVGTQVTYNVTRGGITNSVTVTYTTAATIL